MPGFFERIAQGKQNGPMLAAWVTEGEGAGTKALFIRDDGRYVPAAGDDDFPDLIAGKIAALPPEQEGILETGDSRVFLERISGGRKLVICGAGHVALALIRLCSTLAFEITVIEDREEYAAKAREAGAHRVLCSPFAETLDGIAADLSTAFVVMTREHAHDVDCLR